MIIKKYLNNKHSSAIFQCGDNACTPGGVITHGTFEHMKTEGVIKEVPTTEIIEKYSKPQFIKLFKDITQVQFYEIRRS